MGAGGPGPCRRSLPRNSAFTTIFMRGRGVMSVPPLLLLVAWLSLFLELVLASAVSDGGDGAMALVLARPCAAYARDLAASFDKKRLAEGVRTALGGKCERSGGRDEGACNAFHTNRYGNLAHGELAGVLRALLHELCESFELSGSA